MSELSVTHPNPLLLSSASSASHNIFTELRRTNYFQWWNCHFGAFAWKNILPWEEHTTSWHVFLLFWRGKKWERHTCSFFCSLILFQNRDYKLFLSGRLEVVSNPTRLLRENVDEIHCKRMDMCTYSLMYALEMERRVWRKKKKKREAEVSVLENYLKLLIGNW